MKDVLTWLERSLRDFGALLAALGLYASIILSGTIFSAGLIEVAFGTMHLFKAIVEATIHAENSSNVHPNSGAGTILKGLELLFLAPAVGLTFASSVLYLKTKVDHILQSIASDPSVHGSPRSSTENAIAANMQYVKASVTGLMISVLLTDAVGRVITQQPFEAHALEAIGLSTVLCLAYFVVLSHSIFRNNRMPDRDEQVAGASRGPE